MLYTVYYTHTYILKKTQTISSFLKKVSNVIKMIGYPDLSAM
jgi:preprotein translocase subunit Sss1